MRTVKTNCRPLALFVLLAGAMSCRSPDATNRRGGTGAAPSSSGAVAPAEPLFESKLDAFRVRFPLEGKPIAKNEAPETIEDGPFAGQQIPGVYYYVARGDLTFAVGVKRLPAGADTQNPAALTHAVAEMRTKSTRVIDERPISIRGPQGLTVPGVRLRAEVAGGTGVYNAVFLHGTRMYTVGAAPAAMTHAATYDAFLKSFELLDQR
jgi:hypothetical protein